MKSCSDGQHHFTAKTHSKELFLRPYPYPVTAQTVEWMPCCELAGEFPTDHNEMFLDYDSETNTTTISRITRNGVTL